jgi:hypothetical protein
MPDFKLKKTLKFVKKHQYSLAIIFLLLLGSFLRFYHFDQRWSMHSDPARDALVASQALKLRQLPFIGSFSSAGPFVFGPLFYYFVMISYLFYPQLILAPWILLTLVDILLILIMVKIGRLLVSKKMGLIMGLLTAFSPAQLLRGNSLSQHTFLNLFSALIILNFSLFIKKKKKIFLFLMGLSLGCALSMHYQAVTLFLFIPAIFFLDKFSFKKAIKRIFFILAGFLIPSFPLLYWDSTQGWKNIKNILDFFLIGQYRIWVSRRWLTYIGQFWPDFWGEIINQELFFGSLFIILSSLIVFYLFLKKKLGKTLLFLAIIFLLQLTLTRYYRGELFRGYLFLYHPFVFLFSGLVIEKIWNWKKVVGIGLLALVIVFALKNDFLIINQKPEQLSKMKALVGRIRTQYPDEKFRLYTHRALFDSTLSFELSLFLSFQDLIDEKNGLPLGISSVELPYLEITKSEYRPEFYLYNLRDFWDNPKILDQKEWINASPEYVCHDILEWWKVKEFKCSFSLTDYVKGSFLKLLPK